jgi:hypothetical protein
MALLPVLYFLVYIKNKRKLNNVLPVLGGRIFKKGLLSPALEGAWHGKPVIIEYSSHYKTQLLFITLKTNQPFSIIALTTYQMLGPSVLPIKTLFSHSCEIPRLSLKIYCSKENEPQIRDYLTPDRLEILNYIFKHGICYFETNSEGFIKIGAFATQILLTAFSKTNADMVLQADTISDLLSKLEQF